MSNSVVRRLVACLAISGMLLAFPASAAATITGGCTGEGHSTSSSANLTSDATWHLQRDDVAGGSGMSPVAMRSASVGAYALGFQIPIASGTSQDGETAGSVDDISVSTFAILGHRFLVAGSATGDATCNGQIEIIIDDATTVLTVFGGGGIVLAIMGLLGMLMLARAGRYLRNRVFSALFGILCGIGAGLAAEQFGILNPTQPTGLILVVVLALVGFLTAGLFPARPAATV